jgi:hypothetical protein
VDDYFFWSFHSDNKLSSTRFPRIENKLSATKRPELKAKRPELKAKRPELKAKRPVSFNGTGLIFRAKYQTVPHIPIQCVTYPQSSKQIPMDQPDPSTQPPNTHA